MKVQLKANYDELDDKIHNLDPELVYEVIGIAYDDYQLMSDRDEPICYPKYLFEVVDPTITKSWVFWCDESCDDDEDAWIACHKDLSARAFFDDWHDSSYAGHQEARRIFAEYLRKHPGIRP